MKSAKFNYCRRIVALAAMVSLQLFGLTTPSQGEQYGDFTYQKNGDGIVITKYTGSGGEVFVPGWIDGLKVTEIGWGAFSSSDVSRVVLPLGLLHVDGDAFYGCTKLMSISIPGSVKDIGPEAFGLCVALTNAVFGVGIESIGDSAFWDCTNLTGLILPSSVSRVEGFAFSGCSSLRQVTLGAGLTNLGDRVFSGCSGLLEIRVDPANPTFSSSDGVFFDMAGTRLVLFPAGRTGGFSIPTQVTEIGDWAFGGASITSVIVPSGVTTIGQGAFAGSSINRITLPEGVTDVREWMFSGSKVVNVVLPDSVNMLRDYAFQGCENLRTMKIPNEVLRVGSYAFSGCAGLTNVDLGGGVLILADHAFEKCNSLNKLVMGNSVNDLGDYAFAGCVNLSNVVIGNSVTNIGVGAFSYCSGLTNVELGDRLRALKDEAFLGCYRLGSIEFPAKLNTLGADVFSYGLSNIIVSLDNTFYSSIDGVLFNKSGSDLLFYPPAKQVAMYSIPSGTRSVKPEAFADLTNVERINVPDSVTNIEEHALENCRLASIDLGKGIRSIGDYAFASSWLTNIVIPESVTRIGSHAFWGCRVLMEAEIASKFVVFGVAPFGESGLTRVVFPEGITAIWSHAFEDCAYLSEVTIPSTVVSIGSYAFAGSGLKSVTIPGSVTTIGTRAFECPWMRRVLFTGNAPSQVGPNAFVGYVYYLSGTSGWGSSLGGVPAIMFDPVLSDYTWRTNETSVKITRYIGIGGLAKVPSVINGFPVTELERSAFAGAVEVTAVEMPDGITILRSNSFMGCTGMTNVVIPTSVKAIEWRAFSGCGLTQLEIPEGVTNIGDNAFEYCAQLRNAKIPTSLSRISDGTFRGCYRLTNVVFPPGIVEIGHLAFERAGLAQLMLSDSLTNIGVYAFRGCQFSAFEIPSNLVSIANGAFADCTNLMDVSVAAGNLNFQSVDGVLFDYPLQTLLIYPPARSGTYIVPASVMRIEHDAFSNCAGLTGISLPERTEDIGDYVFQGCVKLSRIEIPNNVTNIGYRAFSGCSGLTNVIVGSGVEIIGESAFEDCLEIKHFEIPDSVTDVGSIAFEGCVGLTNVTFGTGVTRIGAGAFRGCNNLPRVEMPNSVTNIDDYAFDGCSSLTNLVMGNGVRRIGWLAFESTGVVSLRLPVSLETIDGSAFFACSNLTSVYFDGDAPALRDSVFVQSDLATIYYKEGTTGWGDVFGGRPTVPWRDVSAVRQGGKIVLTWPEGVLLESTNLVGGPWVTNGAASWLTVDLQEPQKFYRIKIK